MRNPTRRLGLGALVLAVAGLSTALPSVAQERPYREGSVWILSFIKTKNGMSEDYLRDVVPARKKLMEEAKKEGLVLSYKILQGSASNRDDWDVLIMEEYRNWAAFDGVTERFDKIVLKTIGDEDARRQLMIKRIDVRELWGDKVMQELVPK